MAGSWRWGDGPAVKVIGVVANYQPHTKLRLYRKFGIAEDAERPIDPAAMLALAKALAFVKPGDCLVVRKLDPTRVA